MPAVGPSSNVRAQSRRPGWGAMRLKRRTGDSQRPSSDCRWARRRTRRASRGFRMRLLFLAKHLDGHGIGVHTVALGRWLLSRGVASAGGALEPQLNEAGSACFRAPFRNRFALVGGARATLAAVRRFRPDVI